MKSADLNRLLIETFPELKEEYEAEVGWQDGDDTGSHIVYGDVLNRYFREGLAKGSGEMLSKGFSFIETVLEMDDPYATNVIVASVLFSLEYDLRDRNDIRHMLGPKTRRAFEGIY